MNPPGPLTPREIFNVLVLLLSTFLFGVGAGCAGSIVVREQGKTYEANWDITKKPPATVPAPLAP